jgi:hypothetical protein
MTPDLALALAPAATYDALAHARTTGRAGALAGRLLLAVAVIGMGVAVAATGRVSVELLAGVGLSWSFAVAVQALAAAVIILPARARTVTVLRAFELWFQAHVPWSLWLLLPALYAAATGGRLNEGTIVLAALVPMAWTVLLLRAFARRVLRARHVVVVIAAHQLVVWGLTIGYIAFAIGGWDRVLDEVGL